MSVKIIYHGRTGNNMFQYIFGRLMAIKNGLYLETDWIGKDFFQVTPYFSGKKINTNEAWINDLYVDNHDQDWFSKDYRKNKLIINGFFQTPKYYDSYERVIKDFVVLQPTIYRPDNEIVIHLRLGDYFNKGLRSVINPEWHIRILNTIKFTNRTHKLFIVVENPDEKIHKEYIKTFDRFNPIIISQKPHEDFNTIREFKTIICSNSSFCWWAAWFSKAEKIFTFSKWIREQRGYVVRLANAKRMFPVNGDWLCQI